jgi:hypothetical protein
LAYFARKLWQPWNPHGGVSTYQEPILRPPHLQLQHCQECWHKNIVSLDTCCIVTFHRAGVMCNTWGTNPTTVCSRLERFYARE